MESLSQKRFVYYEITGFLEGSFMCHELRSQTRFTDRGKAVKTLEDVIEKWRKREAFECNCLFLCEGIWKDGFDYIHQFVFKSRNTELVYDKRFKVERRMVVYYE